MKKKTWIIIGIILGVVLIGLGIYLIINKNRKIEIPVGYGADIIPIERISNDISNLKIGDQFDLYVTYKNDNNEIFNKPFLKNIIIYKLRDKDHKEVQKMTDASEMEIYYSPDKIATFLSAFFRSKTEDKSEYLFTVRIEKSKTKTKEMSVNTELQKYLEDNIIKFAGLDEN